MHLHCVKPDSYNTVPCTEQARKVDNRTCLVQKWHADLFRPLGMCDLKYKSFLHYCTEFFVDADRLWCKDRKGEHKLVIAQDRRLFILSSVHDDAGHHRYYATHAHIALRYWGPLWATTSIGS